MQAITILVLVVAAIAAGLGCMAAVWMRWVLRAQDKILDRMVASRADWPRRDSTQLRRRG